MTRPVREFHLAPRSARPSEVAQAKPPTAAKHPPVLGSRGAGLSNDDDKAVAVATAAVAKAQADLRTALARLAGRRQAELMAALDTVPLKTAMRAFRTIYLGYQSQLAAGSVTTLARNVGVDRSNMKRRIRSLSRVVAVDRRYE